MPFKKGLAAAAVMIGVVGGGLMVASPASAATSNCPSGALCVWKDTAYRTAGSDSALVGFQNYVDNYAYYSYGGYSANDSITSVYNNGNTSTVYMYIDKNFSGYEFQLGRGTGDGDLSNTVGAVPTSAWNDKTSSGEFV